MAKQKRNAQIGLVAAIVLLLACFSVLMIQGSASANSPEQPTRTAVSSK